MAGPTRIAEEDLNKVLEPDLNSSTFDFGQNPDGKPRTWKMKPLPWKYEKNFRSKVMPMLALTYKPFETMLGLMSKDVITEYSPSLVDSVFAAETQIDEMLVDGVLAILLSQDRTITKEWVEDSAENREQLMSILERQCDLHKIMDRLGESLAERFVRLARMTGAEIDLASLKRLWMQVSALLSERITTVVSQGVSAIGGSTESLSETTYPIAEEPAISDSLERQLTR